MFTAPNTLIRDGITFGCSQWQQDLVHIEGRGCYLIHPVDNCLYFLPDDGSDMRLLPLNIETAIIDEDMSGSLTTFLVDVEEEDYAPELFGLNVWNGKLYCLVYTIAYGTHLIEIDPATHKARTVASDPEYDCTGASRYMVVDGIYYTATDTNLVSIDLSTGEMKTVSLPDLRTFPPSERTLFDESVTDEWNFGMRYVGFYTDGEYGYVSLYHDADCTIRFSLFDPSEFSYMPLGCPSAAICFAPDPDTVIPNAIDCLETKDYLFVLTAHGLYRIPSDCVSAEGTDFEQFLFPRFITRERVIRFKEESITWRYYVNAI